MLITTVDTSQLQIKAEHKIVQIRLRRKFSECEKYCVI